MWEEKTLAEEAFIWPPRSYSCSFCGKEFRSAQALGGHMNVHRMDRARLKQSPVKSIQNPSVELNILDYPNQGTYDQSVVLSAVQDHLKRHFYSFPPSRYDSTSDHKRLFSFSGSKIKEDLIKKKKARPRGDDFIKYDHFPSTRVSLNLQVINPETTSCKERITDHISQPLFLKAAKEDKLDLELRLGR